LFGVAAKPFAMRLESVRGRPTWTAADLDGDVAERAHQLFAEGKSVRDVAEELRISKSKAGRFRR